jgi:hypothetical protein
MVLLLAVASGVVIEGAIGGDSSGRALRRSAEATQVVRWSPFTKDGNVKRRLHVSTHEGGCDVGSTSRHGGGAAYHCTGDLGGQPYLIDPCWRDGPGRARAVICVTAPWSRTAYRLRVSRLMIDSGVSFREPYRPWALTLTDGNRCVSMTGAVGAIDTPKGRVATGYACAHDVYLGRNLRRTTGRWRVSAARVMPKEAYLGELEVAQAFFIGLPRGDVARQHRIAAEAARAGERFIRATQNRVFGKRLYDVSVNRVRLALPDANWAQLRAYVLWGGAGIRTASVVLHRVDGQWTTASGYRPFCTKLPASVRVQLFTPQDCR